MASLKCQRTQGNNADHALYREGKYTLKYVFHVY
jgi:hypothetical protein